MSLKYVLHLTAPERQWLTRIAKGRGTRPRPALWKVERARALLKCDAGPQGTGWTDEAAAALGDAGQVLPFGGGQVQGVFQGHGKPSAGGLDHGIRIITRH